MPCSFTNILKPHFIRKNTINTSMVISCDTLEMLVKGCSDPKTGRMLLFNTPEVEDTT